MSARYESLRAQVLGEGDGRDATGLVLLLRRGMVAWVEDCAAIGAPAASPMAPPERGARSTDEPPSELVRLLATMILHHDPKGSS